MGGGGSSSWFAMDNFRDVRGQSLIRRGTPLDRAQILGDTFQSKQLAGHFCGIFAAFSLGFAVGCVSTFLYLIYS
jgi:hypothetical protein